MGKDKALPAEAANAATEEAIDTAILCGGRGTRLGGILGDLPKPMAPLKGRPLLEHLVRWALRAGSKHIVLCAGYGAAAIRAHFSGDAWSGTVEVSEEPEALGTGGALRFALPKLQTSTVLAINGDSFLPGFDPAGFMDFHRGRVAGGASIVLTSPDERTDTGNVIFDGERRVRAFAEKEAAAAGVGNADGEMRRGVNAGIYLISHNLIAAIPPGRAISLEREVLPGWIPRGLYGYVHHGRLVDIGTPERLRQAQSGQGRG